MRPQDRTRLKKAYPYVRQTPINAVTSYGRIVGRTRDLARFRKTYSFLRTVPERISPGVASISAGSALAANVTVLSIDQADTAGGDFVEITGTNFTGVISVTYGGTAATSYVVINSTTIYAVLPAKAAGTYAVAVTNASGSGTTQNLEAWGPQLMALTGFWDRVRAGYDAFGGSWAGNASAGSSTGRDLTQGTFGNTPAENNLEPDCDGVNDRLVSAVTATTFWSTSAWMIAAIVEPMAAGTANAGAPYNETGIVADTDSGYFQLTYSTAGLRISQYDTIATVWKQTVVAAASGAYHLAIGWFDGVNLQLEVDGIAGTPVASNNTGNPGANGINVGCNYNETAFLQGKIRSVLLMNVAPSGTERAKLLKWARNSRGLAA
jgi:hypothetical protein